MRFVYVKATWMALGKRTYRHVRFGGKISVGTGIEPMLSGCSKQQTMHTAVQQRLALSPLSPLYSMSLPNPQERCVCVVSVQS